MPRTRVWVALSLLIGVLSAQPGAAVIIDINATANNFGNPVSIFLTAGTYTVTPIGIAGGGLYDAWNPWGTTSCIDLNGCAQTIPTTVTGWKNSYDVLSDDITAVIVSGSPLSSIPADPLDATVMQDYWVSNGSETDRYHVDDATVYAAPADAAAKAESSVFTLITSGFVGFSIRDNGLADNLGGMSLQIIQTPEPSTGALLGLGLAAFGLRRRRARR